MSNDVTSFREACERLERAWWEYGRPPEHRLRPGLSDAEIDALLEPRGRQLSEELRAWWSWHDGSERFGEWYNDIPGVGPGPWLHLSLAQALELEGYQRDSWDGLVARGDTELADMSWKPGFMPFTHRVAKPNHLLVSELDGDAPNTVSLVTEMGIERDTPTLSFVDVLNAWAGMLESGAYAYEDGQWQPHDEMYLDPDPARLLLG